MNLCPTCGSVLMDVHVHHICPAPLPLAQVVARPPVTCPVCLGKTTMPPGFYVDDVTTSALRVTCRSCGGRGIV